ncbi:phage holin [Paenibacillus sp. MER 78]|uniref:phage holin n=1 Tax=Paenibacillus sp. MER 78 TaxID=2939571 RepID=UPI002040E1C8|nr:phage holin [Paenibacillus sp. MER 78]MCM3130925.1 phage holin [Paenibacillus sp. MER 78]
MIIHDVLDQAQPYIVAIVLAIIGLLTKVIVGAINKLTKKASDYFDANLSVKQREMLHKIAAEGYAYAESVYKDYGGEEKLNQAFNYVSSKLGDAGLNISSDEIRGAIEKAWNESKIKKVS